MRSGPVWALVLLAAVVAVAAGGYLAGRMQGGDPLAAQLLAEAQAEAEAAGQRADSLQGQMERRDSVYRDSIATLRRQRDSRESAAGAALESARARLLEVEASVPAEAAAEVALAREEMDLAVDSLTAVIASQDAEIHLLEGRLTIRDEVIAALQQEVSAQELVARRWQERYEADVSFFGDLEKAAGWALIGASAGALACGLLCK